MGTTYYVVYHISTAVSSEALAKLRDWASVAGRGWLLLSGSVAHASLKTAVYGIFIQLRQMICVCNSSSIVLSEIRGAGSRRLSATSDFTA